MQIQQPQTLHLQKGEDPAPSSKDVLLECLAHVALELDRELNRDAVTAGLPLDQGQLTPSLLLQTAGNAGLQARMVKVELGTLATAPDAVILLLQDDKAAVLESVDLQKDEYALYLPAESHCKQTWTGARLAKQLLGYAVQLKPEFAYDERAPETHSVRQRHWFWKALYRHRKLYRDTLVAAFVINAFATAMPLFVMNVYDRVVPNAAIETLWVFAVGLGIVLTAELALRTARAHFVDIAGNRVDRELSAQIMHNVLGMRLHARPVSTGSFAANLRAFEVVRDFVTATTITTLIDLPFALLFIAIIAWISPALALPLLIGGLLLVAHSWSVQSSLRHLADDAHRSGSQRNATLIESLVGLEDIKSQSAEGLFQRRWERVTEHLAHTQTQLKLLGSSVMHGALFVQQMTSLSIVVLGVYLIIDHSLSMGGLIAAMMLTSRAMQPLAQLAGLMTQYYNAKTAMVGLDAVMESPSERPESAPINRPHLRGRIEFQDVSFRYPNSEVPALQSINLSINTGEKVAILGRAGSGKSTILRIILGLYQPEQGQVRLDGIDIRQLDPHQLRQNMGYVPQHPTLFYGSLRENLLMGRTGITDFALMQAAEQAGLQDMINAHPQGFDMLIGERGETLSGGQRQGVALARSLVGNPLTLLMDEPTSAMDRAGEDCVRRSLTQGASGRTLVLVTHRPSMLRLVDRIVVLDHGRIVADGAREKVLQALQEGRIGPGRRSTT